MPPGKILPSDNPTLSEYSICFFPGSGRAMPAYERGGCCLHAPGLRSASQAAGSPLWEGPPVKEHNSGWSWFCLLAGIALVYAVTGVVCVSLSAQVANVSWMLSIPAGLSIMASLMWGSRVWPAVFAGALAMACSAASHSRPRRSWHSATGWTPR